MIVSPLVTFSPRLPLTLILVLDWMWGLKYMCWWLMTNRAASDLFSCKYVLQPLKLCNAWCAAMQTNEAHPPAVASVWVCAERSVRPLGNKYCVISSTSKVNRWSQQAPGCPSSSAHIFPFALTLMLALFVENTLTSQRLGDEKFPLNYCTTTNVTTLSGIQHGSRWMALTN